MNKKNEDNFDQEFMYRHWTMPPRCICRTKVDQLLGRVSPSLLWLSKSEEEYVKIHEWNVKMAKYHVYKRRASRQEWKFLWRLHRENARSQQ